MISQTRALFLLAMLACALATATQAATFTVTVTSDSGAGSLRDAVGQAESTAGADTIEFAAALAGQAIGLTTSADSTFLTTALLVASADGLVIDGAGAPGVFLEANDMRIFRVASTGILTLRDISIRGTRSLGGQAASIGGGKGGGGASMGGVIFNQGNLTLDRCTFSNNEAEGGRGGFSATGNSNGSAGGGPNGGTAGGFGNPNGTSGGDAGFGGGGGGGGNGLGGIAGNGGDGGFGGGAGGGGGNSNGGGTPGTAGAAGFGGGLAQDGTSNFGGPGGNGAGMGGAIFNHAGTITAVNCTFSGNIASQVSGAMALGGAIFNRNGTIDLLSCTFADNEADEGGAVYNLGDAGTATAIINNTIMVNSVATEDFRAHTINGGTSTTSGVGNVMESQLGFGGTVVSTTDPSLGSLASNGGPTETHAITAGSSAQNAGNNAAATGLTVDQTGNPRVVGGTVDAGSFEIQPANTAPTITAGTAVNVTVGTPVVGATIATVSDAEDAAGTLSVQATNVPTGITVTLIVNTGGTITADISATGAAATGPNLVELTVTDSGTLNDTDNLTVNVAVPANTAPSILAATPIARVAGAGAANDTIATVSDAEDAAGTLVVTVLSAPTGILVTSISNAAGTVTADIEALATASNGANLVTLQVEDSGGLVAGAQLTVNVSGGASGDGGGGDDDEDCSTGARPGSWTWLSGLLVSCVLLLRRTSHRST